MIEGIPKISVLIICYKQEVLIKRAIDSLLVQKDYLYEICVSDDCSPDNTWQVLLNYQSQYPDLLKLHRNEPNVGIFENFEQSWKMPTGDVIYQLAGDDKVGENYFKAVVDFITQKGIDYKNELLCIYGDFKCIYPNGDSFVHKQNSVEKGNDAFRLALRGIITNRGCCFSKKILDKFRKVSQGRSHIAENIQDRQLQIFSEKNYYIPMVGNIYYSAIGISVHLSEELKQERMKIWPYTVQTLKQFGIDLNKKDLLFVKHRITYQEYVHWGNKKSALKSIWYYLRSFDLKLFLDSDTKRNVLFAIIRRLPHKHIINM